MVAYVLLIFTLVRMNNNSSIVGIGVAVVVVTALVYFLFREEPRKAQPVPTEGGLHLQEDLDKKDEMQDREMFVPTNEWQPVKDNHICPPGLEYKINIYEGTKYARLVQ